MNSENCYKLRLVLSLIGSIWFIGLAIFYQEEILAPWGEWIPSWPSFLIVGVLCILGVGIEFKSKKAGRITLLIGGITNGILNFIYLLIFVWYIAIPFILILIVGILALREFLKERKKEA